VPVRALQVGLVAAFREAELAELAAGLGIDLDEAAGPGALPERALELARWCERRGRMAEMARAAADARPGNEQLRAAALLAAQVQDGGRRVGTPQAGSREAGGVDNPGYGNGVQQALGRYGAQIDGLRESIDALRRDVEQVHAEQTAARKDREAQWRAIRALVWLDVIAISGVVGTVGLVAWHAWPG
jgi:hypothetical protein